MRLNVLLFPWLIIGLPLLQLSSCSEHYVGNLVVAAILALYWSLKTVASLSATTTWDFDANVVLPRSGEISLRSTKVIC